MSAPPVLVLGYPRSGTTWAANALTAAAGGGPYVHEPCNYGEHPDLHPAFLRWRPEPALAHLVAERLDTDLAAAGPGPRPVVKDVHALFALAAVAQARSWPVVVVVRHPCAVAASWLDLGWPRTGLPQLRAQPDLLHGPLAPFADHLAACDGDRAAEIGAAWGAVHLLLSQMVPDPAWLVHEQACLDPANVLEQLLTRVGVSVDDAGRAFLHDWLATHDQPGQERMNIYRVAAEQPDRWRTTLDPEVAGRVLAAAEPFGQLHRVS